MPGYSRRRKEFPDPHAYLEAVMEKRVRDSVLNFQMSQGYEPKEILPDYLPSDKESGGNAVLMFWANPLAPQHATVRENGIRTRLPASVRVATVPFQMRRISQISDRKSTRLNSSPQCAP